MIWDLNCVVYDYGILSCRRFTGEVLDHLPEDIRNMIAGYLTDEGMPVVPAAPVVVSNQIFPNRISVRDAPATIVTNERKNYLD